MSTDIANAMATGGASCVVALSCWVNHLIKKNDNLEKKYESISREAIECLSKVVDREENDKSWKDKVVHLLETIRDCRKD